MNASSQQEAPETPSLEFSPLDSAVAVDASVLEVVVASREAEFAALRAEWDELLGESEAPQVFQTWDWIWTWWENLGADLRLWLLVAREPSGRLVGVAPFGLRRYPIQGGPCRELTLLGVTAAAGDHHDVIVRRHYAAAVAQRFAALLQQHGRAWDVLSLDRMAGDSRLLALLRSPSSRGTMVWETTCPYLLLPATWEQYMAALSKNTRRRIRKTAKHWERDHGGEFDVQCVVTEDQLTTAIDDMFRLHQQFWTARGKPGAFGDANIRRFHRELTRRLLAKDQLRLHRLSVRERTVAVQYDFQFQGTLSLYQGGYDSAWAEYSPGAFLMAHTLRDAIERGLREVDFLRGEEVYKHSWTKTARRDLRARFATTARGQLLVGAYRLYHAARQRWRRHTAPPEADAFADSG